MTIQRLKKIILTISKALPQRRNDRSIKFLDETEYLLSSKANKENLMQSIAQIEKGEKGKTIEPSDLWK